MEIAVVASLFAKRDMDVNSGHALRVCNPVMNGIG